MSEEFVISLLEVVFSFVFSSIIQVTQSNWFQFHSYEPGLDSIITGTQCR